MHVQITGVFHPAPGWSEPRTGQEEIRQRRGLWR